MASTLCSFPTRGLWFRFSTKARFHDTPGWPSLRRYLPVDKRILARCLEAQQEGARIIFYRTVMLPSLWDKTADPMPMLFVEIANPDYDGPRFLPEFFGYKQDVRERVLARASIVHVSMRTNP